MDLVEEVAIAYGYENFESVTPQVFGVGVEDVHSRYDYVKELLAGFGFIEVFNWLLTSKDVLFTKMNGKARKVVEILHPKTEDLTVCRDSLVPQLIEFLGKNKHNDYPQNIFEIGDALVLDKVVRQDKRLAIALAHSRSNYSELKAVLDVLFKELGVEVAVKNASKPYFISGRAAELVFNGVSIGFIGEIHPQVIANYDLKVPVVVCDLDIKRLIE